MNLCLEMSSKSIFSVHKEQQKRYSEKSWHLQSGFSVDLVPANMAGNGSGRSSGTVGSPLEAILQMPLPLFAIGSTEKGRKTSKDGELGDSGGMGWRRSGLRDGRVGL